ncbi:MAG: hypothetical protein ACTSWM_04490 [Alphaproteobacteria bacterium]
MLKLIAIFAATTFVATFAFSGEGRAVTLGATARAVDHQCSATVSQVIQQTPNISDRVESISYTRQRAAGDGAENRTIGWDARIHLADFDGVLVVDLTTRCGTRQVYTRGHDSLPDIKAFCL